MQVLTHHREASARDNAVAVLGALLDRAEILAEFSTPGDLFPPDSPVSLLALKNAAERAGLKTRGVRVTYDQLRNVSMPAIVHLGTDGGRFAVVGAVGPQRVHLSIAPRPYAVLTREEFCRMWTGTALVPCSAPAGTESAMHAGLRDFERTIDPPTGWLAMGRDAFIDYLLSTMPPLSTSRTDVERIVDHGDGLDLPSWPLPDGRVYHRTESWNWLFHHSIAFHEPEVRAVRATRERASLTPEARDGRCCLARDSGAPATIAVRPQRFQMRLELRVDVSDMEPGMRIRMFLPYPLTTAAQRDVRLVAYEPECLPSALVPEFGYAYGVEARVGEGVECRASYTAEFTGYEIHSHGFGHTTRPPAPNLPLRSLLEWLKGEPLDEFSKAFTVYDWMVRNGRFEKTINPCLCGPCCSSDFERDRAGHCIVLAHAFVQYCEMLGIRARPVRGALFTHPRDTEGQRFGVGVGTPEPVVGHTWAEFEVPGVGWLPVEFHAIVLRATGEHNCVDPELRAAQATDFAFLREFYFGNSDNQRVACSNSSISIPLATYEDPMRPPGCRWLAVPSQRVRTDLEFEYI